MSTISSNLKRIRDEISRCESVYGRPENAVKLLAVSKTKPISMIMEAIQQGQCDFGENYVDDALSKITATREYPCEWHFIGHLQSNKTKAVAENFSWIHTIDRVKTAQRLSRQRPASLGALNCCIQINIDREPSKSGIPIDSLSELMHSVSELPNLNLRGLMVIPAPRKTQREQREIFSRVYRHFSRMQAELPQLDTLSMGMSEDMEAAIAEGSTMVRIGTAVFGARQ